MFFLVCDDQNDDLLTQLAPIIYTTKIFCSNAWVNVVRILLSIAYWGDFR